MSLSSTSSSPPFVQQGIALAAMFVKDRPTKLKGAVGVTTFISETLRAGRPFTRPNRSAGKKTFRQQRSACAKGQHVGRRVDQLVRTWIVSGSAAAKATTKAMQRRVTSVMSALSARGIKPVAAQVLAVDRTLGICSYIDAVGVDRKRTVWVIELKCTTDPVAVHEQLYDEPASKGTAQMTNGMRDTQRNHHFLQAGFGAHALRQTYSNALGARVVKPCVIVSCTDGTRFYTPGPAFSNPITFRGGRPEQRPAKAPKERLHPAILRQWPPDMAAVWPALQAVGYTEMDTGLLGPKHPECVVLRPPPRSPGACAVAVCLNKPWRTVPRQGQTAVASHLIGVLGKARGAFGKAERVVAVALAPSPSGAWEVAFIKKGASE